MDNIKYEAKKEAACYVYNSYMLNPELSFNTAVSEYYNDDGLMPNIDDIDDTVDIIRDMIGHDKLMMGYND